MPSFANAGRWGSDNFVSLTGVPLAAGTNVTVVQPGTSTPVLLYSGRNRSSTVSNPVALGTLGNLLFYADPGEYDLLFPGGNRIPIEVHPYNQDVNTGTSSAVSSVNGMTGAVTGLALQSALDTEISTRSSADSNKVNNSSLAVPGGVATLDGTGKLLTAQRPPGGSVVTGPGEILPGVPAQGCYFGARVFNKPFQAGTFEQVTAALETKINGGRVFKVHRHYTKPSQNFDPSAVGTDLNNDAAKGRTSILSMRPPTDVATGRPHTWAYMAAQNGAGGLLETAAKTLKNYATGNHNVIIVADHEPDLGTDDITGNVRGTPLEFGQFMTEFFKKVRLFSGPNVTTAVCFVGYKFAKGTMSSATVRQYLPAGAAGGGNVGLDLVDMIATDPYNQSLSGSAVDQYSVLVDPWVTYADSIGKPLGSFEVGILHSASTRSTWWNNAFDYVEAHSTVKILCAWHDNDGTVNYTTGDRTRDYWIDGGTVTDADATNLLNVMKTRLAETYFTSAGAPVVGGGTTLEDILTVPGDIPTFSTYYQAPIPKQTVGVPDGYVATIVQSSDQTWDWQPPPSGTGGLALTARGDLFGYSAFFHSTVPVPVGADGTVLTADSSQDKGWVWRSLATSGSGYSYPIVVAATDADASWKALADASNANPAGGVYVTGGTRCDGADDNVQINAALAVAAFSSRPVLLSPGHFLIQTSAVGSFRGGVIMPPNSVLRGCGEQFSTVTLKNGATGITTAITRSNHVLINQNTATTGPQDTNLTVEDITFDGNAAGNSPSSNSNGLWHGVKFWNVDGFHVRRVTVVNCRGTDAGNNETFHFDGQSCNDGWWNDCTCMTTFGAVTSTGFASNNSTNMHWNSCVALAMQTGHNYSIYRCRNFTLDNCVAQSGVNMGFNFEHSEQGAIANCISGGLAATAAGKVFTASQDLSNGTIGFSVLGDTQDAAAPPFPDSNYIAFVNCHNRGGQKGFFIHAAFNTSVIGCSSTGTSGLDSWGYEEQASDVGGANQLKMMKTNIVRDFQTDGGIAVQPTLNGIGGMGAHNGVQTVAPTPPAGGTAMINPFLWDMMVYLPSAMTVSITDTSGATITLPGSQTTARLQRGCSITCGSTPTGWKWVDA